MKTTLSYYKPLQKTIQNSLKQQLLSVFWVQIFPQHLNINIELITYFTRILNLRFFFTEFSFFFKGLQKYVFLNNRFYNSLFHLLFTEIFCTKGHINFCTEALLQKFLYWGLTTEISVLLSTENFYEKQMKQAIGIISSKNLWKKSQIQDSWKHVYEH